MGESVERQVGTPQPQVVALSSDSDGYQSLLKPPATVRFRSGCNNLKPGETVGEHSTSDYEEILVVLDGQAEISLESHPPMAIAARQVAYIPPHTKHDVKNTGIVPLRFIYVVSLAE
jgi:mannose-6-phosphate isomerase-like protein (cupin superfamily)